MTPDELPLEQDIWDAGYQAAKEKYEPAIRAILAEPHGCPFCDSGKLRNPNKGHGESCGFAMAEALTRPT